MQTVKFTIEDKTKQPQVVPSKPVKMVRKTKTPSTSDVPSAPQFEELQQPQQVVQPTPEQLISFINNQRVTKAQRKQQRMQTLVAHAF